MLRGLGIRGGAYFSEQIVQQFIQSPVDRRIRMPVGILSRKHNQVRAAKLGLPPAKIFPNQPFQAVALHRGGNVFPRNHQAESGRAAFAGYRKHEKIPAGNLESGGGKHGSVVFRPQQARRAGKPGMVSA